MIYCPICQREYATNPKICKCGFDGLEFEAYNVGFISDSEQKKIDFCIYKFAKRVFKGKIPYERSDLMIREDEGFTAVCEAVSRGALAYVDPPENEGGDSYAEAGLLTLYPTARALILNTDGASSEVLDESHVMALFIGKRLKSFDGGSLIAHSSLRFIEADAENPSFFAENNVLFSKDRSELICYAPYRPEEEYRVPKEVRYIGDYAFYYPRYLKRLYIPSGAFASDNSFLFEDEYGVEIIEYD